MNKQVRRISKHERTASRDEKRRAKRAAKKLLRSQYFFNKFLSAMKKSGLVGEARNAQVLFVVATSCILDRPLNIFVKGQSSAGKNWLATRVLNLFPESAIVEITSASEQAWSYSRSNFRHRVVYLQERNEAMGAMDPMRLLISEGKIVRMVPTFEGRKLVTKKRVARGPVAAISTTTKNRLQIDDETRHISIWVDESKEQTRQIVSSYAREDRRLSRKERETWRTVHRILKKKIGTPITFPKWFERIAEQLYVDDLRVRRYFPAFVEACRVVALLRSIQRDHNHDDGHLKVNFVDFAITALIFDHVFVESLPIGKGVGEGTRRVVEAILHETGKPVRAEDIARKLTISMDTAYRKLRSAEQSGVIRLANKPEKSNRKKYWALPAPRFVPDPKTFFRKLRLKETVKFVHPLTGEKIVYKPRE
jgi:hypothetical protein